MTHRIQPRSRKSIVTSLDDYKKLQYDKLSDLIRFNRDLLEVYSNNHALICAEYIHDKLTEFQNIFVSYLMTSNSKKEVDRYKEVVEKFISTLMSNSIHLNTVIHGC